MSNEFAKPTYLEALKDRMGELRDMPGNLMREQMGRIGQGAIMNPNARPSTPADAMPADVDPQQRQQLIEAIMQRQGAGQMPGMPQPPGGAQQPVDPRQLLLQEAARRGIQIPPDSPLLQGEQLSPDNPAGIQF